MRVAFVCSGKPDNLKYLKNNRDLLDNTLSKNGWEVVNTPLSNILDLNKRLQEYSKNSIDEFLFFYTGHGDVSNRQQILKLQLDNVEISINDVLDSIFKYINPKKQAIVLDACYSGTLKDLALENNTEFLFSSQAREQSYEDDVLEASVFSYYFCDAISKNKIFLNEISKYISLKDNRQNPLSMNVGNDFIKIAFLQKVYFNNKIFLAEVSDDLELQRIKTKNYLEDYGYDVYPKEYLPLDGNQYKDTVKNIMKECKLFIQILSHLKGRTPPNLLEGYREAQFNIAIELKIPIMQWHSKTLVIDEIEDLSHKKLLSTSFIQTIPLVDFNKAIVTKMSKILEEEKKKEKTLNSFCTELPFIFINATVEDRSIAQSLHKELKNVCIVAQPLYQGSASEIREDLEDNILECNYYVLVYSKATVGWVRRQLMQYRKYDRQRKESINAILIYEGPPEDKEEVGITFPFISVINGKQTPAFNKVQQLINKDRA